MSSDSVPLGSTGDAGPGDVGENDEIDIVGATSTKNSAGQSGSGATRSSAATGTTRADAFAT